MGSSDFAYKAPACPVCGKDDAARMGSSAWAPFEGLACSDACGQRARDAILIVRTSSAYLNAREVIHFVGEQLRQMDHNALKALRQPGAAS